MATTQAADLVLNIAPVALTDNRLTVGRMSRPPKEAYSRLRQDHWRTHAFRFDSRSNQVLSIAIDPSASPVGDPEEVRADRHRLLVATAIVRGLAVWLSAGVPILRDGYWKGLSFWGVKDDSRLLSAAARQVGVAPVEGLEVCLRYDVDCRVFLDAHERPYLGLVIDIASSNLIDITVADLVTRGLDAVGRYVAVRGESQGHVQPRLRMLGQVAGIEGSRLLLADSRDSTSVDAREVFLEPRTENVHEVIKLCYGPKARSVLSRLDETRSRVLSGTGRLELVRSTLDRLRSHRLTLADGVQVQLGQLADSENELWPSHVETGRPALLFGSQGTRIDSIPDRGIREYGPYMHMFHQRTTPTIGVICESKHRGKVEQFVGLLRDGLPDEMWQGRPPNPLRGGLIGKFRLQKPRLIYEESDSYTADSYLRACKTLLTVSLATPDLVLMQVRERSTPHTSGPDPYLPTKAHLLSLGIPSQALRIETVELPLANRAYAANNVALASYAKMDGIPWVMSTLKPTSHEVVLGLGCSEVTQGRLGAKSRYYGITSVFQGDGRYLVWGLSREADADDYEDALFGSLEATMDHVRQANAWQTSDAVRVICHAYKRLRNIEVKAMKRLVQGLAAERFRVEFAFLDITSAHPYCIFAPSQPGVMGLDADQRRRAVKGVGVPPRGLCLQLDRHRGLLHLTGPKEVKTSTQGMPRPLLVDLHPESDFTDMAYLLRQVYHFSYMSWRSFLPSSQPVTILYSELIASLLGRLSKVPEWNSSVLTVLRDKRWFL